MTNYIPEEFWEVLIKRYERMPPHIKVVIGGFGAVDRDKIIEHLKKRDEIGELIAQIELNYLKLFKEEAESL